MDTRPKFNIPISLINKNIENERHLMHVENPINISFVINNNNITIRIEKEDINKKTKKTT